ncbi:MAG: hypothetical protein IT190_09250 [Microbacteriaceae bacterium]|nr:hypothetical protein [Microbacteriaceae bacterium]
MTKLLELSEARSDYRSFIRRGMLKEAEEIEARVGLKRLNVNYSDLFLALLAGIDRTSTSGNVSVDELLTSSAPEGGVYDRCPTKGLLFVVERGKLSGVSVIAQAADAACSHVAARLAVVSDDDDVAASLRRIGEKVLGQDPSKLPLNDIAAEVAQTHRALYAIARERCMANRSTEALCLAAKDAEARVAAARKAIDAQHAIEAKEEEARATLEAARAMEEHRLEMIRIACLARSELDDAKAGRAEEQRVAKVAGTGVSEDALRALARRQIAAERLKRDTEKLYRKVYKKPLPYAECPPESPQ